MLIYVCVVYVCACKYFIMKELLHKKKQGTYPHVVDVTLNLSPRINRYFKCFKIDQKPLKRFVLLSNLFKYNINKFNNAFYTIFPTCCASTRANTNEKLELFFTIRINIHNVLQMKRV